MAGLGLLPCALGWWPSPRRPATAARGPCHRPGVRLLVWLGLIVLALGLSWYGIERLGHLRLTLFQPFRMATVFRGLCLVVVADHLKRLWERGEAVPRTRAALLLVGLAGDWMLVAVTLFEAAMTAVDGLIEAGRVSGARSDRRPDSAGQSSASG